MKKIFIVAIAAMLCFVMLLPVSAMEYTETGAPKKPTWDYDGYVYEVLLRTSNSTNNTWMYFYSTKPMKFDGSREYFETGSSFKQFYCKVNNFSWGHYDHFENITANQTFNSGSSITIYWSNHDIVNTKTGEIHHANDHKCDGSACPATDLNTDNICDDCGAMFAVLRDYTPSDFPSGYPSVPSLNMPDANYYLYKVNSTDREYLVVYPSAVTPTYDTTKQNGYLYFSESYGSYELNKTTNEWELSNDDSPYFIGGTNNNSVDIKYSSDTIYDQNGDTFFPIPLWMEMEQVTQGEMKLFNPTMVGILTTLTVCGVGCLALLVVLKLFGKRSLIFRN